MIVGRPPTTRPLDEEKEEDYFASMTDMMVGVLFVFILLLMYFALQLREATDIKQEEVERLRSEKAKLEEERNELRLLVDRLSGAEASRRRLIKAVATRLQEQGIRVSFDLVNGILRLPEEILFDSGRHELKPEGKRAVQALAAALGQVLPCYALGADGQVPSSCRMPAPHRVETLFVEGHTDSDGQDRFNWTLSTLRAIETYAGLLEAAPSLMLLTNHNELPGGRRQPLFSVSGYGWHRPVANNDSSSNKAKNRRIDLRIVMERPSARELEELQQQVKEAP